MEVTAIGLACQGSAVALDRLLRAILLPESTAEASVRIMQVLLEHNRTSKLFSASLNRRDARSTQPRSTCGARRRGLA